MTVVREKMALSFGAKARDYDRLRPRYPQAALDAAIGGAAIATAVDLGAGTGLLTTALCAQGLSVIAVEPDAGMVEVLATRLPAVRTEIATAEHMPLPDASVDAVFVGQAFHWFTRPAADREIARVLRPGGIVAVLTNVNPADADYEGILHKAVLGVEQPGISGSAEGLEPGLFSGGTTKLIPNPHQITVADFLTLPTTWSWVATAAEEQRAQVMTEAEKLAVQIADPGGQTITMPYSTKVIRAVRARA